MTQKDERGKMRQFLLKNEKGIFIHKFALEQGAHAGSEHAFHACRSNPHFPADARHKSALGRAAQGDGHHE